MNPEQTQEQQEPAVQPEALAQPVCIVPAHKNRKKIYVIVGLTLFLLLAVVLLITLGKGTFAGQAIYIADSAKIGQIITLQKAGFPIDASKTNTLKISASETVPIYANLGTDKGRVFQFEVKFSEGVEPQKVTSPAKNTVYIKNLNSKLTILEETYENGVLGVVGSVLGTTPNEGTINSVTGLVNLLELEVKGTKENQKAQVTFNSFDFFKADVKTPTNILTKGTVSASFAVVGAGAGVKPADEKPTSSFNLELEGDNFKDIDIAGGVYRLSVDNQNLVLEDPSSNKLLSKVPIHTGQMTFYDSSFGQNVLVVAVTSFKDQKLIANYEVAKLCSKDCDINLLDGESQYLRVGKHSYSFKHTFEKDESGKNTGTQILKFLSSDGEPIEEWVLVDANNPGSSDIMEGEEVLIDGFGESDDKIVLIINNIDQKFGGIYNAYGVGETILVKPADDKVPPTGTSKDPAFLNKEIYLKHAEGDSRYACYESWEGGICAAKNNKGIFVLKKVANGYILEEPNYGASETRTLCYLKVEEDNIIRHCAGKISDGRSNIFEVEEMNGKVYLKLKDAILSTKLATNLKDSKSDDFLKGKQAGAYLCADKTGTGIKKLWKCVEDPWVNWNNPRSISWNANVICETSTFCDTNYKKGSTCVESVCSEPVVIDTKPVCEFKDRYGKVTQTAKVDACLSGQRCVYDESTKTSTLKDDATCSVIIKEDQKKELDPRDATCTLEDGVTKIKVNTCSDTEKLCTYDEKTQKANLVTNKICKKYVAFSFTNPAGKLVTSAKDFTAKKNHNLKLTIEAPADADLPKGHYIVVRIMHGDEVKTTFVDKRGKVEKGKTETVEFSHIPPTTKDLNIDVFVWSNLLTGAGATGNYLIPKQSMQIKAVSAVK